MTYLWTQNVRYETETNRVIFARNGEERSPVEREMEYLEELYPEKSWLEIVQLAVPELKSLKDLASVRFYSL